MMLLEAAAAAAFAAAAITVYTQIINKQLELTRRARDLDLIEAVVNQDINAIRHYARMWRLSRGPYSAIVRNTITTSNVMTYGPNVSNCTTWDSTGNKGMLDRSFRSDLAYYSLIPGAPSIDTNNNISIGNVPGYKIVRNYSWPITTKSAATNITPQTLRVTYIVTEAEKTTQPFAFERAADIQIPAGFYC